MARNFGGQAGTPNEPTRSNAPGSWISPTDIARQRNLDSWPVVVGNVAQMLEGSYTYAISSGVALRAVTSGYAVIPSGQTLDGTDATYSGLYDAISGVYGLSGDNFDVPDSHIQTPYFRPSTVDLGSTVNASGVLPTHTHTHQYQFNATFPGRQFQNPKSPMYALYESTNQSNAVGNFGDSQPNNGRYIPVCPLIVSQFNYGILGTLFPVLLPSLSGASLTAELPENTLIPSGQDLSRTDFAQLYELVGDIYGSGDGTNNFTLPDTRGVFLRRSTSNDVLQGLGTESLASGYVMDNIALHTHRNSNGDAYRQGGDNNGNNVNAPGPLVAPATGTSNIGGSDENRPKNVTVVYCLVTSEVPV